MNCKTLRNFALIPVFSMLIYSVAAQNSQVLYNMNVPQNHLLNPALRPTNSAYIGMPGLSGFTINVNNNFLNFSDIFINGGADSLLPFLHPGYDPDEFLSKIKEKNSIEPGFTMPLFGLGFSAGKDMYIFLDIIDRFEGNVVIPKDLFRFSLMGAEDFIGSDFDLSSLKGNLKYYREIGLGFSRNFSTRLRVGVKAKLLFGIASASIDARTLALSVKDEFSQSLDADVMVNLSAPLNVYISPDHKFDSIAFDDMRFDRGGGVRDFMFNNKNFGLGLDIGATYEISRKLTVSAAVTDLGYIKWKSDLSSFHIKSRFEFNGLDLPDVYDGTTTIDNAVDGVLDSLENSYTITDLSEPFKTYMPFGITFGSNYDVTDYFRVGLLSYSRVLGKQLKQSLTLSANLNLGSALSLSLAYTAANHRYDNLGAGLAFRAGFFQFYSIVDRIPLSWNRVTNSNGNSFSVPSNLNTINARFGINFVFGNKTKKKLDKPMVFVE